MAMFWSFSLRRLKIYSLRRGYAKYGREEDKVPLTLQECIDKPTKNTFCRPYIMVLLIVPIIFYMFYYKAERKPPPQAFFEIFPKKKIEIVTENVAVMKYIFNVSQPNKEDEDKWRGIQSLIEKHITTSTPAPPTTATPKRRDLASCIVTRTGNVTITTNVNTTLLSTERIFPDILMGGSYSPPKCHAKYRVVIIVPYRDRAEELSVFIYNIHLFLMHQKLEYRIFVVEQQGNELFNRGRLLNAGFLEIQKMNKFKCVIFHDVDLLPLDDRILYTCTTVPKHMCANVVGQENMTTSRTLFGGVTAMSPHQFKKVNGFSNLYWGMGGEDNDLFWRFKAVGLSVARLKKTVARYMSLSKSTHPLNPQRYELLSTATDRFHEDGLKNIKYAVKSYSLRHLYTHVVIDINPRKLNYSENFLNKNELD